MASNFKISLFRAEDKLHCKLNGDFDGSSAFQLIDVLKSNSDNSRKFVIHTNGISSIHPFGLDVFNKQCRANKIGLNMSFKGKFGETITRQIKDSEI